MIAPIHAARMPAALRQAIYRANGRPRWDAEIRRRELGDVLHLAEDWNDPMRATLTNAAVTSRGVVRCVGAEVTLAEALDSANAVRFVDGDGLDPGRVALGIDYFPHPEQFGTGAMRLLGVDVFFARDADGDGLEFFGKDDPDSVLRVRALTASDTWDLVPLGSERYFTLADLSLAKGLLSIDFSDQPIFIRPGLFNTRTWRPGGPDDPQSAALLTYRPISLELYPMGDSAANVVDAAIYGGALLQTGDYFARSFTPAVHDSFAGPAPPGAGTPGTMAGEFNARTLWGAIPEFGAVEDNRAGTVFGWFGMSQRVPTTKGQTHITNPRVPYVVWKVEQFALPFSVVVDIDLGAVPVEGVGEWRAEYVEPNGTAIEIVGKRGSDLAVIDPDVEDGETFEEQEQTYHLEVTGTPGPGGWTTPELHKLGVEFFATEAFVDQSFEWEGGETSVDPMSGEANVAEAPVVIARAGHPVNPWGQERPSRLASGHYPTDLELELWLRDGWGSTGLGQRLNRYAIARRRPTALGEQFVGVSRLDALKIRIPRLVDIGGGVFERVSKEWIDTDIATVLREVLTDVINVADRHLDLSALPAATGFITSMRIDAGDPEEGKKVADQLAFLCGGALAWQDGLITYVEMYGAVGAGEAFVPKSTVAVWTEEHDLVAPPEVDPGLEHRVPEVYTFFNSGELGGTEFIGEVRTINGDALALLGKVHHEEREEIAPEIARWCNNGVDQGQALAEAVGWRMARSAGSGFRRMTVETVFPQPWVRLGDELAVVTDRWTDRIPQADGSGNDIGKPLRGRVAVPAIVIGKNDLGTRWTLWVRDPQDILRLVQVSGFREQPPPFGTPPAVQVLLDQAGSLGTLHLIIDDPFNRVTGVFFKAHSGPGPIDLDDPADGTWTEEAGPFVATVPIARKHTSVIGWAVRYSVRHAADAYVQGAHTFDLDDSAEVTGMEIGFAEDGSVQVSAVGDEDTRDNGADASHYVTVAIDTDPADPTAGVNGGQIVGRSGSVSTAVICPGGSVAHVKVAAVNDNGVVGPTQKAEMPRPNPPPGTVGSIVLGGSWVIVGGTPTEQERSLDLELRHPSGVGSVQLLYQDAEAPQFDPPVSGLYNINVSGASTFVERVKESDGVTPQVWVGGTDRPPVLVTARLFSGADGTGTKIGEHQLLISQFGDTVVRPVSGGGTGVTALTAGALVKGADSDPVALITGDVAGRLARWTGTEFSADPGPILANERVDIDSDPGQPALVAAFRSTNLRWQYGSDGTAEGGGNAGSDWALFRYDDAGAFLGTALAAKRDTGEVLVGDETPNFDPAGSGIFRITQRRSSSSPGTPGGTNHMAIFDLVVDTAHPAPNTPLIGAVRLTHTTGHMSGAMGMEGFVHAGGTGSAGSLFAVAAQMTMFDSIDVTEARALHALINANGGWTGLLTDAYGLYVEPITIAGNNWAVYTAGTTPSKFGGPVEFARPILVEHGEGSGVSGLVIDTLTSTTPAIVTAKRNGANRWLWGADGSAEGVANTGNDWFLSRFDDAGAFLGAAILVERATGDVTLEGLLEVGADRSAFAAFLLHRTSFDSWEIGPSSLDAAARLLFRIPGTHDTQFAMYDAGAFIINRAAGARLVRYDEDKTVHWQVGADGSAGDDFAIFRYNDSGTFQGATMLADRGTGDVTFEGSVTENSSRVLKSGIRDLDADPLALIAPLRFRRFRKRADGSSRQRIGIIAEEAAEVASWLTGSEGKVFDLSAGLAVTMAAVQRLHDRLSRLEA